MAHRRASLLLIVFLSGIAVVGLRDSGAQGQANGPRFVPSEVIVKYSIGTLEQDKGRARRRANGVAIDNLARTPAAAAAGALELVRIPANASVQAAIAQIAADPAVEYAEPNWIYTHGDAGSQTFPSDPSFGQLWGLHNTGQPVSDQTGGTPDADIDAPEAWFHGTGSQNVFVGVIDEGVDVNHADLSGVVRNPGEYGRTPGVDDDGNGKVDDIYGWDFVNNNATVYDGTGPTDTTTDAPGTHVTGTIGARGHNGVGVTGVNWQVGVVSAKFLGPTGGTTANAVKAIDYLTDLKTRGVDIVATNNSWGGGGKSKSLEDAIVRAAKQNILFIAAAGNGGADGIGDNNDRFAHYPSNYNTTRGAGYDAVIAVAATGRFDDLRPWSNYGRNTVDLGAPGSLILSTTPLNTYEYFNGTSMATPHVTGTAALISATRALTGAALRSAILGGVDPNASLQGKTVTGGRLNAHSSMQ